MKFFKIVLCFLALVYLAVSGLHLVLGVSAEALLGAKLSSETLSDPSLNSQNRFYGVAFALNAVVLYLSSKELQRYELLLRAVCYLCFLGGLSRGVSWLLHGAPSPWVVMLGVSELLGPPILLYWLRKLKRTAS